MPGSSMPPVGAAMLTDTEGMNLVFDFSDRGISEREVEDRLFWMRDRGYLTLGGGVNETTVTSITQRGKVYLHSLRT